MVLRFILGSLLVICSFSSTLADERIGAFVVFDGRSDVILLDGEIETSTPLDFRRALEQSPKAQVLVLNSPGGLVASGLILADDVRRAGLSTLIPEQFGCYSACSFVYFAGIERQVDGELGVHQMWADDPDPGTLQVALSDVIDAFEKFAVPSDVLTRMLRTDSSGMYVYPQEEIHELELNQVGVTLARFSVGGEILTTARWSPGDAVASEERTQSTQSPSLRLAIYGGIDFYGNDIGQSRALDAVECAAACLGNMQCQNFTFNANPNITSGPNCFLKDGVVRLETYSDALSGIFLDASQATAPTYSVGGIDPTSDTVPGRSLAGQTLAQSSGGSGGACRMACVDEDQCLGYSFMPEPAQCTLFATVERSFEDRPVVSGIKRWQTFEPISVIDLDQ